MASSWIGSYLSLDKIKPSTDQRGEDIVFGTVGEKQVHFVPGVMLGCGVKRAFCGRAGFVRFNPASNKRQHDVRESLHAARTRAVVSPLFSSKAMASRSTGKSSKTSSKGSLLEKLQH